MQARDCASRCVSEQRVTDDEITSENTGQKAREITEGAAARRVQERCDGNATTRVATRSEHKTTILVRSIST